MPGLIRPPYGEPTGPFLGEHDLFTAFLRGARTGHSATHHIEESALLLDRMAPVALRLVESALLVRTDLPSPVLVAALPDQGVELVIEDTPLATVVSLEVLGLPAAAWDLWCAHHVDGERALIEAVSADMPGAGW